MLLTVTALPSLPDITAPKGEGGAAADAFAPLIAALAGTPADGKALPSPGQPVPVPPTAAPTSGETAMPAAAVAPAEALDAPAPPLGPRGAAGRPGATAPIVWSPGLQLATSAMMPAAALPPTAAPVGEKPVQPPSLRTAPPGAPSLGQPLPALPDEGGSASPDPAQGQTSDASGTTQPQPTIASFSATVLTLPASPARSPAAAAPSPSTERLTVAPLSTSGRARVAAKLSTQAHEDVAADHDPVTAVETPPDAVLVTLSPDLQPAQTTGQAVPMPANPFTPMPAVTAVAFAATATPDVRAFTRAVATTRPTATTTPQAAAAVEPLSPLAIALPPGATTPAAIDPPPRAPPAATPTDPGARFTPSAEPQPRPVIAAIASPSSTLVAADAVSSSAAPSIRPAVPSKEPTGAIAAPPPSSAPVPQPATPVIVPALQAFGAAMRQALADERRPAPRLAAPAAAAPAFATTATAAAPTATFTAAPLDTADARWPQAMAQHIERLRDAADTASTRIRLLPDALGPVDVTVRREGDAVHVHLAAPSAETRQLLQDAQPRLAEAAEQRGLKLARAEVGANADPSAGGDGGDRQPARAPAFVRPPRAAPTAIAAEDADDTRIA